MNFTHVLISRPAADNERLAADLRAAGFRPLSMPAFEFRATVASLPTDADWSAAPSRVAIFTSPRAVRYGMAAIPQEFLDGVRVAAVGPATRTALESAGQPVELFPDGRYDSEGLLALPAFHAAPGMAVIFTAPGGRTLLQDSLAARGWGVRTLHVYERVAVEPEPGAVRELLASDSLLSIWTSAAALDALLAGLPPDASARLLAEPMLVVSQRLAEQARLRGARQVVCTEGPGNADIVASVRRIATRAGAGRA